MAYEHREGSGTLFPNQYKKQDNHPDWRGDAMINGVLMEVSGWNKGERISLAIKKKEPRPQGSRQPDAPQQQRTRPVTADLPSGKPSSPLPGTPPPDDDDVPFNSKPRSFDWGKLA